MKSAGCFKKALAAAVGVGLASQAAAFDLTGAQWVQYGDAQSYSLPVLAYLYDQINGGGTGPGNPFYVNSTPGQIKDLIVVATGADGGPVTKNFDGMDNAYPTPTGKNQDDAPFFSTQLVADPKPNPPQSFVGDLGVTWDATVASLKTFLGNEAPIFFFNNNQTDSGGEATQSLAAWARLWLTDPNGNQIGNWLFTNNGGVYRTFIEGGGGVPNGDVTLFSSNATAPVAGTNMGTDYVLSGGALCLTDLGVLKNCDGSTLFPDVDFDPTNGLQPETIVEKFSHNLGANQAAYAITFPELNAKLADLAGNVALNLDEYTLHVDLRLGCDPASTNGGGTYDVCTGEGWGYGRRLNNGYEQLFIGKASTVVNTPEPASLALLGLGMVGMGMSRRRRKA